MADHVQEEGHEATVGGPVHRPQTDFRTRRRKAAVPGLVLVHGPNPPPLAAAAMVGATGVLQHAEQALAVTAVDTDAAAALASPLRRMRRGP